MTNNSKVFSEDKETFPPTWSEAGAISTWMFKVNILEDLKEKNGFSTIY
jgi:hypothetical protein